jgi:hypothetical protein
MSFSPTQKAILISLLNKEIENLQNKSFGKLYRDRFWKEHINNDIAEIKEIINKVKT